MIQIVSDIRSGGQVRETFRGPRDEARKHARGYLDRYPKGGYMTVVADWHERDGGEIEYTMTRLSSAD